MPTFLIDLDGVVYRGNTLIKGVPEAIARLRRLGSIYFLTNNSTLHRIKYVEKLRRIGIQTSINEIITSGFAAARYIAGNGGGRVLVIGEEGLIAELRDQSLDIVDDWRIADYVCVGLDRSFNYEKLSRAFKAVTGGAVFIATNRDVTLPLEGGLEPGAGAIVSSIEACTGREPILIGKPSTLILEETIGIPKGECIVVGDRFETDLALARRIGARMAMVLTGATSLDDVEKCVDKPDIVLDSIAELPDYLGV